VPDAVRTGTTIAKASMVDIPLAGATVPHAVVANFGASKVVIKPGAPGTGVKAGGAVRAVMEAAGVRDIVTKSLGSRNPINVVKAAIAGLGMMQKTAVDGEPLPARGAVLPPISPDRRGPLRREGGGGFRGRDRDRDRDRRGPSGPPRAPSSSPPRADGSPSDSVVAVPAEAVAETISVGLPADVVTTPPVEPSAAVVLETPAPSQDETIGTTNDG
jgi:hypothetical protein